MYRVIYALMEASTHDEALSTGKAVFDRLVGADLHTCAVFDYYVWFDKDDTTVAGKARWGELPEAAPVESEEGQELLECGWEATEEEFQRNLERVREALHELTDEEIMRDEDLARHAFHQVGAYDGPSIFLYNEYENGIRHREQLDRLLEESEENLWIVPADVRQKPQVLVYGVDDDGNLILGAVEYIIPDDITGGNPDLFDRDDGAEQWDAGPFPGVHSLHVWVHTHNPEGVFSHHNPRKQFSPDGCVSH